MRFLHTADWHIGKSFSAFSDRARDLRAVRVETLERALSLAAQESVDFFIVAGDLFDDPQVGREWTDRVFDLFKSFDAFPIVIVPGNHDPAGGPSSVWRRAPFNDLPSHIHVPQTVEHIELDAADLLVSPLFQKKSTRDPAKKLDPMAQTFKESSRPLIGVTHGSLALAGVLAENDHPIHPESASDMGLDYLALGHWHNGSEHDDGKIVMPGTPEPDTFGLTNCGNVVLAELEYRGDAPKVTHFPIQRLTWADITVEMDSIDGRAASESLGDISSDSVVRVTLEGAADSNALDAEREEIERGLESTFASVTVDQTIPLFSESTLATLGSQNHLIAATLNELTAAERLILGPDADESSTSDVQLSLKDIELAAKTLRVDIGEFDTQFFRVARRALLRRLQEVAE